MENQRKRKLIIASVIVCQYKKLLVEFQEEDYIEEFTTARKKPLRIENYVERNIPGMNARNFQSHFRITRTAFDLLLPVIDNIIKKKIKIGRPKISTEKQLLATIWILATPDSYRSVGEKLNMGKSSLSSAVFRCIKAINTLAPKIIKWPALNEINKISNDFYNIAGVDNIIGAIDGTFIPIKAPVIDPEVYISRKCNYAITLQATCISNLKFTDCFVGYPSSVSDTRIFRNSDLYQKITENPEHFFYNKELFIIGDKAYPVLDWCIPPYIDRGNLSHSKKYFNLRISQTRQVIERSFALLFGRFRRLKYLDMNRTDFIPATILSACVLHNICLDTRDLQIEDFIVEGLPYVCGNDVQNENRGLDNVVRRGHNMREIICQNLYELRLD